MTGKHRKDTRVLITLHFCFPFYTMPFNTHCNLHTRAHARTHTLTHTFLESRSLLNGPIVSPEIKDKQTPNKLEIKKNSTLKTISKSLANQLLLPVFQERRTLAPPFQKHMEVLGQPPVSTGFQETVCVSALSACLLLRKLKSEVRI